MPAALAAVSGIVVLALLGLMWFGLQQKEIAGSKVVNVPFTRAPDFTLGLFDGSSLTLSDALKSGKPVVVNFWASWCAPCADEAPVLEEAARRNGNAFTFVGVNVQDIDSDAQVFLR
ncbi:MAG: TlpA family protein disulfide reductase, partial [Chloroflexi bacterium]|nr:TlpA family protein disulfide reductase [Chloroflexota bacterium]